MIGVDVNVDEMVRRLSDVEKRQLPFALSKAMNDTAFQVREGWAAEVPRVFDRPTVFTQRAILFNKATKAKPYAEVYVRDQATKGTPPSRYLAHHVNTGARPAKASENLLRRAGVLGSSEFYAPAKGVALDAFGNIPRGVITAILSDVQAARDSTANSTRESRGKRARRKSKRGGVYFYNRAKRGALPRGIFERIETGFGSAVRMILAIVRRPTYSRRFDAYGLARRLWSERFARNFREALARALATAR